jgi:ATP-binding cassette subfamily F protein 3
MRVYNQKPNPNPTEYRSIVLNFTNLGLRRGTRELLHDVNCVIHAGQRVGLTGANGVGKSSLFALIRHEIQPDSGDFTLPPNTCIAHVAQETPAIDRSALDYVMDGDSELRALQRQIESAERANDGDRLAQLYADMEHIDGYTAAARAGKLMHGLGFTNAQEQTAVREFSGGWRMRLNLAQALMCRSDLLLLDEPTNHLDLEAVIWLEDWLLNYAGTLILISHDRDFLDRVVNQVAHIEQGGLTLYSGNYSEFEKRRAEMLAGQQAAYLKQQREIEHMQKFIARFKAKASKARQAQSRVKALERMETISAAHVDSPFQFEFKAPAKIPNLLLHLDDVAVGYDQQTVLSDIKFEILAGHRIGLLGYNGAGKSTLIKLLAGELQAKSGQYTAAKDLSIGYFAQHQVEQLDDDASALLHLQRQHPKATEKELRNFLGGFAFRDDMATCPVVNFSGGEKARLVLAMIVLQAPNLLLLDEPTNHLDLEMRHALNLALQGFEGAMVIVSHDRHMLRTVTDRLLLVANGNVSEFAGDIDDYRQWVREQEKQNEKETTGEPDAKSADANKKQQRRDSAEARRKTQPLRNQLKKLEKEIEKLNTKNETYQQQLADTSLYEEQHKEQLQDIIQKQAGVQQQLAELEDKWLQVTEALEQFE